MSRSYATVVPSFWTGSTGKALRRDPDAQRLAFYLMTSPHTNMAGLYYVPLMYIAHETGLTIPEIEAALGALRQLEFAWYDAATEYVFVRELTKHQVGEPIAAKDGKAKKLRTEVAQAPAALRCRWLKRYAATVAGPEFWADFLDSLLDASTPPADRGAGGDPVERVIPITDTHPPESSVIGPGGGPHGPPPGGSI